MKASTNTKIITNEAIGNFCYVEVRRKHKNLRGILAKTGIIKEKQTVTILCHHVIIIMLQFLIITQQARTVVVYYPGTTKQ